MSKKNKNLNIRNILSEDTLKEIKNYYHYDNNFEELISFVENHYLEDNFKVQKKKYYLNFETSRLEDCTIEEVINYLNTFNKNAKFEFYCGYYDTDINLYEIKDETNEDYIIRISSLFRGADNNLTYEKNQKKKLNKRKEELLKELNDINNKLN